MFSRYNAMAESAVLDSEDNLNYPDPLSINYTLTQLRGMPKLRSLDATNLDKFWVFMQAQYQNTNEGDDILLTLNNIPYRGVLEPGDEIYVLDIQDIYSFNTQLIPEAS